MSRVKGWPNSTMLLRRLRFRVIEPGFRVNLCGIVCGETVAVSLVSPQVAGVESIAPEGEQDGGQGWIRTSVLVREQIYSLPPLTTRPPTHVLLVMPAGAGSGVGVGHAPGGDKARILG